MQFNPVTSIPSLGVQVLGIGGVLLYGVTPLSLAVCFLLYIVRMFAITAGYHRYFSHRSYRLSRGMQFTMAVVGASAAQMGPLWWASHHRRHHRHSDTPKDLHSPAVQGFFWSHIGWILSDHFVDFEDSNVRDLKKYPELVWLDRYHMLAPLTLGLSVWAFGFAVQTVYPQANTSHWQMLLGGFFLSTTLLYHATFSINSLAHMIGRRDYETRDHSRNSFLLALVTLGEGWHNNHHRFPWAEKHGIRWYQIDLTHTGLRILAFMGLASDFKLPPNRGQEGDRYQVLDKQLSP